MTTQLVSWSESVKVFTKIALHSFGGPAGQIAVMHRILVEEKRWISETRFLHALNYCMLLPGPEAMQLITYVGWLMHRTLGGIVAGTLFVLPGFISILVLSILYAGFKDVSFVEALFFGIKPAVLAIVVEAVVRIGRRALRNGVLLCVAALAFLAIFFLNTPFPVIVLLAGLAGFVGARLRPQAFVLTTKHAGSVLPRTDSAMVDAALDEGLLDHARPSLRGSLRVLLVWGGLWLAPLAVLWLFFGSRSVFFQQAAFFSKAAVVTFGGAYAVLAYLAQAAVETYGWLSADEMLDGLGMAETTPGPLIQVVQFVGFMGAYRHAEPYSPLLAGIVSSLIVTWVTYVPCFLWIFLGAPYIESLRRNDRLSGGLSAITAAVVGVILNLAIWFSLHTLFDEVVEARVWGLRLLVPQLRSLQAPSILLAAAAMIALFYLRLGMMTTLLGSAILGMAYHLLAHS